MSYEIGGGRGVGLVGPNPRGAIIMTAGDDTVCTLAGTWYILAGTYAGQGLVECTVSTDGIFTYTGSDTRTFHVSGVISVTVDRACTLTFGSRVNGVNQPGGVERTFLAQSPDGDAVQFGVPVLSTGDNFQAIIQSDTANTTVTLNSSFGNFWGEYL